MHRHDEGPEEVEVLSGSVIFIYQDGTEHRLASGDRLSIPAGQVHTFRNASKTEPLVCLGSHGPRFERACDQFADGGPTFTRLCRYLVEVDPGASYMVNPVVRLMMRMVAAVGRMRSIAIATP